MWLAPIAQIVTLVAMVPQAGPDRSVPGDAMPPAIATRQTLFAIPFRIDPPDQASPAPVEVQLYVSGNRGATWDRYSQVEPARRQFVFQAGGDGEYWFQIRTVDRLGQFRPEPSGRPALRVIVDTVPPKLELQARRGEAGQIIAQWKIDEPQPNLDSLTLQYRTTTDGPWQQVAVGREQHLASGTIHTGEVTWWPHAASGEMQIRAEVADKSGNPAVSHAKVDLNSDGGPSLPPAATTSPVGPWRAAAEGNPPAGWPAQRSTDSPLAHDSANPYPETGLPEIDANPAIQNQYVSLGKQNRGLTGNGLPPGERPHMVNSRLFELEYEVESVGPSGISRVELWGTRDGGRNWKSFTLDNDNRSPLLVSVDEEGIYGFTVVVQSRAGLGGRPPQSGQLPEIRVGVDLTEPAARIIAAEQGTGPEAGKLIVSWQASDQMLAARPVSILFSDNPGGPWTTIASGLENTGRYVWPIGNRVPRGIYLRLEVRDEAGNVGVYETNESIALDRLRPSVRIRDVRPLGQSGRSLPKRYDFR